MANDLCIITTYFNPCGYLTKKLNFDIFAARLKSIGVGLTVVEMALEDRPFELDDEHSTVRVRGNGVTWQKERMLNIAIAHLPPSCTKVAWLDCDLLFEDDDWVQKTVDALERFMVVQPFSNCIRLPRGQLQALGNESEPASESFAAAVGRDRSLARHAVYEDHGHTGFAWAARREVLETCGFYDACLTGSGDHLMAHAFAGSLDSICIAKMIGAGNQYSKHFERWAAAVDRIVAGKLGHVDGRVLHLWHGDKADRRYREHNLEFRALGFDPARDIRVAESGLWEWAEAPEAMRAWAKEMFISRNEDGTRAQEG